MSFGISDKDQTQVKEAFYSLWEVCGNTWDRVFDNTSEEKIKELEESIKKEAAKPAAGTGGVFTSERDDEDIAEMEAELAKLKGPTKKPPVTTDSVDGIVKSAGVKTKYDFVKTDIMKDEFRSDKWKAAQALKAGVTPEEKQQKLTDAQQANLEMKNSVQVPIIVNAPVTNNTVSGGEGATTFITPQKASHDTIWEKTIYK